MGASNTGATGPTGYAGPTGSVGPIGNCLEALLKAEEAHCSAYAATMIASDALCSAKSATVIAVSALAMTRTSADGLAKVLEKLSSINNSLTELKAGIEYLFKMLYHNDSKTIMTNYPQS